MSDFFSLLWYYLWDEMFILILFFILLLIITILKRKENILINSFVLINFIAYYFISYPAIYSIALMNFNDSFGPYLHDTYLSIGSGLYLLFSLLVFIFSIIILILKNIKVKIGLSSALILLTTFIFLLRPVMNNDFLYLNEEETFTFMDSFIPSITSHFYILIIGLLLFIGYIIFTNHHYLLKKKTK